MDEKVIDSGGLPRKESGSAAHVCVGIFARLHDTERPPREYVFTVVDIEYLGSVVCKDSTLFELLSFLPEGVKVGTS